MDDSSDVFTEDETLQPDPMETDMEDFDYDQLMQSIKNSLASSMKDYANEEVTNFLDMLLEKSQHCITQGVDKVTCLIEQSDMTKVVEILEDIVLVLQQLSKLLKDALELVSFSCSVLKNFPCSTARILLSIFEHCKDSESIYGQHRAALELQLKSLFRCCHELQLVYLLVLEKHFLIDPSDEHQLEVLVTALELNTRIGRAVVSLDIKTMVEQWKGLAVLADRYSTHIVDAEVVDAYADCLCALVMDNLRLATQENQDEKVFTRSLKVANFLMKILIKICQTFKHHVTKDYSQICLLLVTLKANSEEYLRSIGKDERYIQSLKSHILNAAEPLLNELMDNDAFASCLINFDALGYADDTVLLGLHMVMLSAISYLADKAEPPLLDVWLKRDDNIIAALFDVITASHSNFSLGMQFECQTKVTERARAIGLYERSVALASALAAILDAEHYARLENLMYESLLLSDPWRALFASDLWVVLARFGPEHLCVDQIKFLIETFKDLEQQQMISGTPQRIYLLKTIRRLFSTISDFYKSEICSNYPIMDESNACIWSEIGVRNMPLKNSLEAKNTVLKELKEILKEFIYEKGEYGVKEHVKLVRTMNLAATCEFEGSFPKSELVSAWRKASPSHGALSLATDEYAHTVWYTDYVAALCRLTKAGVNFLDNADLCQILDVAYFIAQKSYVLKFEILQLLESLSYYEIYSDDSTTTLCILIVKIFRTLLKEDKLELKIKSLGTFKKFSLHTNREEIITKIIDNDDKLKSETIEFLKTGRISHSDVTLLENNKLLGAINFTHKCLKIRSKIDNPELSLSRKQSEISLAQSDNFELADLGNIEALFEQPKSKKLKPNCFEVEEVISRIEKEVNLLDRLKENVSDSQKARISMLCDRLKNVCSD